MSNLNQGEYEKMPQMIGVPKESYPGEKRVATVPDVVQKLIKLGMIKVVPRERERPSARVESDLRRRLDAGEWSRGEALPTVSAPRVPPRR